MTTTTRPTTEVVPAIEPLFTAASRPRSPGSSPGTAA